MDEDFAALQARHMMQCWSAPARLRAAARRARPTGCWIETTDGRRIFDLRSAHECINLGFRHPKVLAAMRAQMESVVYVTDDFATEPTARLAARLARITPGGPDKKVFFCQSGAAAIEAAIKAARQHKYVDDVWQAGRRAPTRPASTPIPTRSSRATAPGMAPRRARRRRAATRAAGSPSR